MKGYYFSTKDKRLRYGDNREIAVGVTHKVEGKLKLYKWGLHFSKRAIDALKYAPGSYLWIVEASGEVIEGADKCCASERTYINGFDATELLREFARKVALKNIKKIKPYCSEDDYELIIRWLKTGDEPIRAAVQSAARAAAESAFCANVSHAKAACAAEYAAGFADESVVKAAAESAGKRFVTFTEFNTVLEKMIEEKLKEREE